MELNFTLLNSFVDSIAIIDTDGEIIFTNNAWKRFSDENSGSQLQTGPGVNYLELCKKVTGDELADAKAALYGLMQVMKGESTLFELEYPCHSETQLRWFIMRITPVFDHPGKVMMSHINITQRKLAEEAAVNKNRQLELINDRLNTTTYKIVHDIQSPLNSIQGLIGLTRMTDSQAVNPYLSLMEGSILKLKNYIQDTLKISTSAFGSDPIDFNKLLNQILESIKYSEAAKSISFQVTVEQPVNFYSNASEVLSIITNIIDNSVKYRDVHKPEQNVVVNILVNEKEAVLSFRDNGIGMDKHISSRIFDLNYQANPVSGSGSGIGLYMVKKSIELMNGNISVDSKECVGTEFIINLPNNIVNV